MAITKAESLLRRYGIRSPRDIDLEAIAFDCGALVTYELLDGCDARIVGRGGKAIITVDAKNSDERKRFSLGHELGHWLEAWRGGGFLCGQDDIGEGALVGGGDKSAEITANRFAADLILPNYLFTPACKGMSPSFDSVQLLAANFSASITATAIKFVKASAKPAMLICSSRRRREWYVSGDGFPDYFYPQREIHHDTAAFELLYQDQWGKTAVTSNSGSAWIDRKDADLIRLREQSIRISRDRILTLLSFSTLPP